MRSLRRCRRRAVVGRPEKAIEQTSEAARVVRGRPQIEQLDDRQRIEERLVAVVGTNVLAEFAVVVRAQRVALPVDEIGEALVLERKVDRAANESSPAWHVPGGSPLEREPLLRRLARLGGAPMRVLGNGEDELHFAEIG